MCISKVDIGIRSLGFRNFYRSFRNNSPTDVPNILISEE